MIINYLDEGRGLISRIEGNGVEVPFYEGSGPSFYFKSNNLRTVIELNGEKGVYSAEKDGILWWVKHTDMGEYLSLEATVENKTDSDFAPDCIGLSLGINSYMIEYPQWNDKFFPGFLRCEKTHFTGYFMSPLGKAVAVVCDSPVAAWELTYNTFEDSEALHFGHRIFTGNLLFTVNGPVPERHPQDLKCLKAGEKITRRVNIAPIEKISDFKPLISKTFGLPMIEAERYTYAKGEEVRINVFSEKKYEIKVTSPSGRQTEGSSFTADEYGVYTVTVITEDGKISEGMIYCRHDYGWYLKAARKNAVIKPQKASTHTESWYGHFSSFLAAKHYPDKELDELAKANFDEIIPYMYDIEKGKPIVIPNRIQNTACLISLMVDLYESDKENLRVYLDYAANMAEDLMRRQTPDGAYRKDEAHYTSVIYISKSMLELALAEKEAGLTERYMLHYESAKRAVYDLVELKERIGTEGEHTLEDGMITCSSLQISYFALTLPEEERAPFIEAAEYLIDVHRCLEELETPDCRMRGATLRFWEAQYDVQIRGNMMNTPHGWTSWKNYATYYLYLLTGKEEYLKDTVDTMGACIQMIDENENLRWAFIKDPWNKVKVMVPDTEQPVNDGYESTPAGLCPAYRGKYEVSEFGETYVDLISGWYRVGEQKVTGGYECCDLYFEDYSIEVDNQGGTCDNDVHEHFKCLEETLLKKAFVIIGDKIKGYNCRVEEKDGCFEVIPYGECEYIHVNSDKDIKIKFAEREIDVRKGLHMICVK